MPTVTVQQTIAPQDAAEAIQQQLGDRYVVDSQHRDGGVLRVKHGGLAFATVRVGRAGGGTTFRVHGGGFIVGRIANELGIARTVAMAIKDAYPADPANPS
jgi:hypothetical protein